MAVLCKLATAISINLASISDNCPLAMLVTGADKILSAKRQETSYYPSGCRCLVTEQEVAVNEYSCSVLHSDTLLHIRFLSFAFSIFVSAKSAMLFWPQIAMLSEKI